MSFFKTTDLVDFAPILVPFGLKNIIAFPVLNVIKNVPDTGLETASKFINFAEEKYKAPKLTYESTAPFLSRYSPSQNTIHADFKKLPILAHEIGHAVDLKNKKILRYGNIPYLASPLVGYAMIKSDNPVVQNLAIPTTIGLSLPTLRNEWVASKLGQEMLQEFRKTHEFPLEVLKKGKTAHRAAFSSYLALPVGAVIGLKLLKNKRRKENG